MPNYPQTSSARRSLESWRIPLPHPSWRGEAVLPDLAQPLLAAEFWKRLGL